MDDGSLGGKCYVVRNVYYDASVSSAGVYEALSAE